MKIFEKLLITSVAIFIHLNEFSECATNNNPSFTRTRTPQYFSRDYRRCHVPLPPSDTVSYTIVCPPRSECSLNSHTVLPGTILNIDCRPGFLPADGFTNSSKCLSNGTWSPAPGPLSTCTQVCGKQYTGPRWQHIAGEYFEYGEWPWRVTIYRARREHCFGNIITPYLIKLGAECFYNQHTPENIFDLQDLEAAVSKVSENYNKIDNPDTKYYKIRNISYFEYNSSTNGQVDRELSALLEIENEILFSSVVQPTCTDVSYYLDWIKRFANEVTSRRQGGTAMEVLPDDVQKPQKNPSVVEESKPTTNSFTQRIPTEPPTETCPLPDSNIYNLQYELVCPTGYSEQRCQDFTKHSVAPSHSSISPTCSDGYISDENQNQISYCINNSWQPELKPCKKICKKLKPTNVNLKCTYQNKTVNCDGDLTSGTVVSAKCIPKYRPEYLPKPKEIRCEDDGNWNAELLQCIPHICEKTITKGNESSRRGGEPAEVDEFPWHVAVYDKTVKSPNDLICGATIITEYIAVSAARCFYDEARDVMRDPGDYEIIVGKKTRDRNHKDSAIQQTYKVKKISVRDFYGPKLRYQNDIAVIEIETKIIFNEWIIPACLSGLENDLIPSHKLLMVAGWGSKLREPSSTLKITKLPFSSINECITIAPSDLIANLSPDTFCVGNVTADKLDTVDVGAGSFQRNELDSSYYLSGIVSLKSSTTPFLTFTNVTRYTSWINSISNTVYDSRSES